MPPAAPELFGDLPETYLGEYKTPCWWATPNASAPGGGAPAAPAERRLRCLPYYYVLGDFNCGVRDLHSRLLQARRRGPGARTRRR